MSKKNGSPNGEHADAPLHVLEILGNSIVGGMETYVINLISLLRGQGFRFTCLSPFESAITARFRALGCEVFITAMDYDAVLWNGVLMGTQIIESRKVDVIHTHLTNAHVLGGLTGRPLVATIHGMEMTAPDWVVNRLAHSDLIVVSQHAYMHSLSLGVPPERLTLVRNGVDTKRYCPDQGGEAFRSSLGLQPDDLLIGFVGRLVREKGPDYFVRLAEVTLRHHPEAHFVLVGGGEMESDLRTMIAQRGLAGQVHMAGTWPDTSEVFPALDALVMTSRAEGLPLAALEAMACGCPVLAHGIGGLPEIIDVGVTGYLSLPEDWTVLADMLGGLIRQPEMRHKLGRAARARVLEHFNLSQTASITGGLLRQAAERAQPASLHPFPAASNAVLTWPEPGQVRQLHAGNL